MCSQGISFSDGFNKVLVRYRNKLLEDYLSTDKKILEIGGAEGLCTEYLSSKTQNLVVLEPVNILATNLMNKFPEISIRCTILEEFESKDKFDLIVAFNVLEHVENDLKFLECARNFMDKDSKFILTVPNALSIHRQLGNFLGKMKHPMGLTETDLLVGHRRYYYWNLLKLILEKSRFKVEMWTGVIYKPFPNDIMLQLPDEYYDALHSLGRCHPRYGAELFVVVRKE